MAEITEPIANAFVIEDIKTYAQDAVALYYKARKIRNEWYGRNVGSIINANWTLSVNNQNLTANEVLLVMGRIDELVADLEAGTNAKLNTLIQMAG